MAIANVLQLEAARATPALSRFNYDAHAKFDVAEPIHCRFTCWYFTLRRDLDLWFLTFDLEHLQRIVCEVMKLRNKFERNRTIRGEVIAISVFDLMTLNMF